MTVAYPIEHALTAENALETLHALRRHARICRQCRIDPRLCVTHRQYSQNFEEDFRAWERGLSGPSSA